MRLITGFFMAWGMFCALPCPYPRWREDARPLMTVFLPAIGLLIGGIWALAAWALSFWDGGLFSALLLAALPWLLSGMIHLDGFMDCCDAIFSRRELSRRQEILKDPHVGSFAVIAMVLLCGASTALLYEGQSAQLWKSLLLLPGVSRCVCALAVQNLKPMAHSQYAGSFRQGRQKSHSTALLLQLFALLLGGAFAGWAVLLPLLFTLLGTVFALLWGKTQLGGMSGDVSGLALTVGEFCGLLSLLFL